MSDDEKKRLRAPTNVGAGAGYIGSLDGGARSYDRFAGWSRSDRDAYSRLSGNWAFAGTPQSFALIANRLSEQLSGPVRRFDLFPVKDWIKVKETPHIARVVVLLPGVSRDRQPDVDTNGKLQFYRGQVTAVLLANNTSRLKVTVKDNHWSKIEPWWNILHQELNQNAEAAVLFGQRQAPRTWLDVPERDREAVQMLLDGFTDPEIGKKLNVTAKTISNLFSKLRAEFPDHVPERERGSKRRRE